MGIKEKLPLLKSSHKIVRLSGYIVYAFLALMVLGAMQQSPDVDEDNTATTTNTIKTSQVDNSKEKIRLENQDEIDCGAVKNELDRARTIYWQNGVGDLKTNQKELIDHCGAGREKDYVMPTTVKEETTKKTPTSDQSPVETTKTVINSESVEAASSESLDEAETVPTANEEISSTTTKTASTSTTALPSAITTSTSSATSSSGYTSSNTHTTSATYTKSAPSGKMYVGSTKSNKYHVPSCRAAKRIKPENEIWFSSSADARAHGYEPCGICNP